MGFLDSITSGVTITARLTPYGRQQLLQQESDIITTFSLGDSDANYYGTEDLAIGRVPTMAGDLGANATINNGLWSNVTLRSTVLVNAQGDTKKAVSPGSNTVTIKKVNLGLKTVSGDTMTQLLIDKNDGDTDGNTNLFHSFGLPITTTQKNLYTIYTQSQGGYLDTAIYNLNQDGALVMAIQNCDYGEVLDGKAIKIDLTTTTGATVSAYTIYSTFQSSLTPLTTIDTQIVENQYLGAAVGNNVAFLFSDQVQKPNNNSSLSWSTGFGTNKPFSVNGKRRFNPIDVPATSTVLDIAVGVAYLDKGIIVITHPDIVNNYDVSNTGCTIQYNSVSNEVAQNVTCIVERDEFTSSTNVTYTSGDPIRVSEVALYDNLNNLIAFAKSNNQIIIGSNQFLALGVKILV